MLKITLIDFIIDLLLAGVFGANLPLALYAIKTDKPLAVFLHLSLCVILLGVLLLRLLTGDVLL